MRPPARRVEAPELEARGAVELPPAPVLVGELEVQQRPGAHADPSAAALVDPLARAHVARARAAAVQLGRAEADVIDRVGGAQEHVKGTREPVGVEAERPPHHEVGATEGGALRGDQARIGRARSAVRPAGGDEHGEGREAEDGSGARHARSVARRPPRPRYLAHGPVSTVPRARARASRTIESGTPNPLLGLPDTEAAKIVVTTRPEPSTIGPPELPCLTSPRS